MGLKSNEIDPLLIRQLKQTANKPVTRLVLLTGFNTPPAPSREGNQVQPVTKLIAQLFLNWHIGILPHWLIISILTQSSQIIQYIRFTFLYQAVDHFAEQGVNPGEPGTGELLWIVFVE